MTALLAFTAAALYLLAAGLVVFRPREAQRERTALGLGVIATALHAAWHAEAAVAAGGIDLHFAAALSWVALGIAFLTLVVAAVRPLIALGAVVFPVAALCLLLLLLFGPERPSPAIADWRIQLHAWLALLAYATLSLAALVALMFWVQERALRRRSLEPWLRALPPLTLVESLLFRLLGAGFGLLTLALVTGVLFVEDLFAQHLWHKTVLSLLAWAAFGILIYGRLRHGWRGRRAVRLVLIAMLLLLLGFFGSKFVLELVLERGS